MNLPILLDASSGVHIRPLVWDEEQPDIEQLSAEYAQGAFAAVPAETALVHLLDMPGLVHARAAVLGARQTGSPLLVWLRCDSQGQTSDGSDILAALLCLQELGIAGFGLSCSGEATPEDMVPLLERLAPYAHVPLAVCARAQELSAKQIQALLAAGARSLFVTQADAAQMAVPNRRCKSGRRCKSRSGMNTYRCSLRARRRLII